MSKLLQILVFLSLFICNCSKDESNPTQTSPQNTDTETSLPPGTADVDFDMDTQGTRWSYYAKTASCSMQSNNILITSSFSGPYIKNTFNIYVANPSKIDTFTLGRNSSHFIAYIQSGGGAVDTAWTKSPNASGQIIISYFNTTKKTIKGTFYCDMARYSRNFKNGSFKATWQ